MKNTFVVIVEDGQVVGVYSNDIDAEVETVNVTYMTKEEKDKVSKKIENLYDVS